MKEFNTRLSRCRYLKSIARPLNELVILTSPDEFIINFLLIDRFAPPPFSRDKHPPSLSKTRNDNAFEREPFKL